MGSYLPQVLLCIKADHPAYEFRGSVTAMMRTFEHADHVPFLELHCFGLGLGLAKQTPNFPKKDTYTKQMETNEIEVFRHPKHAPYPLHHLRLPHAKI